ncbi:basic region leucine zipper [Apiospora arundinis]
MFNKYNHAQGLHLFQLPRLWLPLDLLCSSQVLRRSRNRNLKSSARQEAWYKPILGTSILLRHIDLFTTVSHYMNPIP